MHNTPPDRKSTAALSWGSGMKDNLTGRQLHSKTTSQEAQSKTTLQEDNLKEIKYRQIMYIR